MDVERKNGWYYNKATMCFERFVDDKFAEHISFGAVFMAKGFSKHFPEWYGFFKKIAKERILHG